MSTRLAARTAVTVMVGVLPVMVAAWPRIRAGDRPMITYLVVFGLGTMLVNVVRDPTSNLERRGEDHASESLLGLAMVLGAIWAALDAGRFHVTDTVPERVRWTALIILVGGMSLRLWAMSVNRFFSNLLVIQADRGHTVVDRGPYAVVRHPGYTTFLLILPAMPLAIGSWSALGVFSVGVVAVLQRTAREDRFLHAELPGYADYARRVRARLLPGLY